jgi:CRISPR-associated protein Cas2
MIYVIAYDICQPKRLTHVAKILENYGHRIQKSVFEVELNKSVYKEMKSKIESVINPDEDGVKYYPICPKCRRLIQQLGVPCSETPDLDFTVF